ncbi:4a-hydroxytetrahydrobiopterin dehydratase [Tessaracoccus coleopterorum]|uniref:4a-hydroxytetrahydrobiopterin dehydratase n=1 Tax=Tessaracoccus coleopterorum TaxID=2714950 RepID=UPI0018D39408|nr:4a-hydroxytetrahydrobiopterin dehydratase [Tessaracoccus coleopterorum]
MTRLTNPQILEAGLRDWRTLLNAIHARYVTGDFETGAEFVAAIAVVADEADHHPDVTLTYPDVRIVLTSHDSGA